MAARLYRGTGQAIALPLLLLYFLSSEKELIRLDCERWMELLHDSTEIDDRQFTVSAWQLSRNSGISTTTESGGETWSPLPLRLLLRIIFKPESTLHLRSPKIGPGFFMQHGYATSVGAYSIGKNCSVNQLVVIGWTDRTRGPILGDNVSVKAGAKILGPITIGNNVTVGANAVVTKDVPANCVVAGVPARIIRRNGVRVDEPLLSKAKSENSLSLSILSLNEQVQSDSTALDLDFALSSGGCDNGIPETERAGNPV